MSMHEEVESQISSVHRRHRASASYGLGGLSRRSKGITPTNARSLGHQIGFLRVRRSDRDVLTRAAPEIDGQRCSWRSYRRSP